MSIKALDTIKALSVSQPFHGQVFWNVSSLMALIVTCGSITRMYSKFSWVGKVHICSKSLADENDVSTPLGQ